jgi:ubiquinone/menaquinone biosynthesis C-methylase UbiE
LTRLSRWAYRVFERITKRYNIDSKFMYFLCWAIISLPFVIVDKLAKTTYTQEQSRVGYNTHGSITELQSFERGEKIASVLKALMRGSLAGNVNYRLFREEYIRPLMNLLSKTEFKNVLEVGSGTSINLYYIGQTFGGKDCVAVDFAGNRIRDAKTHWDKKGILMSYMHAGAVNLPFRDSSIDVVFTSHCLEQVAQDRECEHAIDEMYRVCRRQVILMEPSYELGNVAQKFYIELQGYSKHILSTVTRRYAASAYSLLETTSNCLNPTMMVSISKKQAHK